MNLMAAEFKKSVVATPASIEREINWLWWLGAILRFLGLLTIGVSLFVLPVLKETRRASGSSEDNSVAYGLVAGVSLILVGFAMRALAGIWGALYGGALAPHTPNRGQPPQSTSRQQPPPLPVDRGQPSGQ